MKSRRGVKIRTRVAFHATGVGLYAGTAQRWYILAVLIVAYVSAMIDRHVLSLLVGPLEQDFDLSDTQISLLQGFAFALFLAITSIPIARVVDTSRRTTVIAAGAALWSTATAALAGMSTYGGLLSCRLLVGVGEAAMTPAAHSIVADSFPPRRLGLALGIYGLGAFIGTGATFLIGGLVMALLHDSAALTVPYLGTLRSWQLVVLLAGVPGLIIAAWLAWLPEPPRNHGAATTTLPGGALAFFRENLASMTLVNLTTAFAAMASYAAVAWVPSFLTRTYGWSTERASTAYGLVVILCGAGGVVTGGALSDVAVRRGIASGRVLVMAIASLAAAPLTAAAPLMRDPWMSLSLLLVATFLFSMAIGVAPAAQQAITPSPIRGLVSALAVMTVNLIGLGLGPIGIALVTDYVFQDARRVRYSLAALLPLMLLTAAVCGIACLRPYEASIARLQGKPERMPHTTRDETLPAC
jgi:MFS family permease